MIIKNITLDYKLHEDPLCLTIGNFDGVHKGHQFLINKLIENSKKFNLKPGVLSFYPHPRTFFQKNNHNFNIITDVHKEQLLESLGVEIFYKLKFNKDTASMAAEDFVYNFLIKKLKLKSLIIGKNFRFGSNRTGDINLLKKINLEIKFNLNVIEFVTAKDLNIVFSSSLVRENIQKGKFDIVKKILGRYWTMKGIVQKGDQRARQMNFPTANILSPNTIHPKNGVYAVKTNINNKNYNGIANFGRRPTFMGKNVLLEVNIFDFDQEIYGKELTVEFLTFIREEIKFDNFAKLKEQVNKDVKLARSFFDKNN